MYRAAPFSAIPPDVATTATKISGSSWIPWRCISAIRLIYERPKPEDLKKELALTGIAGELPESCRRVEGCEAQTVEDSHQVAD
jgi:hypothetical protein